MRIINAKISRGGALWGDSQFEMRELLAHDALPTLFPNLPVDKSENAEVHVQRPLPLHHHALTLLQPHRLPKFATDISLFQPELRGKLLRFHRPTSQKLYPCFGALISLSSVSASQVRSKGWL